LSTSSEPALLIAAIDGSMSMAAADPRYMPEVVSDTAFALSCGGIHCGRRVSFVRYRQTDAVYSTACFPSARQAAL